MASTTGSDRGVFGGLDLGAGVAFADLPATPALGMIRVVSDATEATVGFAADGGGAAKVLVWYNGTAWRIIGGTNT